MFDSFIDFLSDKTPLLAPLAKLVVIAALFGAAWLIARLSGFVARRLLDRHDRRHRDGNLEATGEIADIKRRQTLLAVIRTGIGYVAFTVAFVLSIAQLTGGLERLTAIAGASFALVITAFATQRVLVDIIAGFVMFIEHWYSVGDTVVLQTGVELQGVVEDVSLRRTRLRALSGEIDPKVSSPPQLP